MKTSRFSDSQILAILQQAEALTLADRLGVPEAARQLGLESGLIYITGARPCA